MTVTEKRKSLPRRFRPRAPLVVLAFEDNHDAALPVPPGKTIDVLGPDEDDRFMVVCVDGQRFLAFAADLWQQT